MHGKGHIWLLLIETVSFLFVPILKLNLTIGGNVGALVPARVAPNTIQIVPLAFLHGSIHGWTLIELYCPIVPERDTAAAHSSRAG